MLPSLCPNLEHVTVNAIERDPVITDAVSEMLLACNRDFLRTFKVDSALTEEAREVVYRLPKLSDLWTVLEGDTLLPPVALPNLTQIDVEYDGGLDWLQGFRGARLEKLESVSFRSESEHVGDPLRAFASVALTTSARDTLTEFKFYTIRSWNPNYTSLLPFKKLKELTIEFTCDDGCASTVDDDLITSLAQEMPNLEILQLGSTPCGASTGATVHGLIILASRCLHLSTLRIHFRGDTLVDAAMSAAETTPPTDKPVVPRVDCALTHLEVGCIPITVLDETRVTLMLLQIFPRICNVDYLNPKWGRVVGNIRDFRRIGDYVRRAGKTPQLLRLS
jgi:hypothetical protein